jgi:rRNA-processing protein FCF1
MEKMPMMAFVLDTNFILSHLDFLKELLQLLRPHNPREVQLIIPFIVIRELDGLKNAKSKRSPKSSPVLSNRSENVAELAQQANVFLYEQFHANHSFLRGQSLSETLEKNNPDYTPDDRILDCARYWQKQGCLHVFLFSNGRPI